MTSLVFAAQDDQSPSPIDVEYTVTAPGNVRFSSDTNPRLLGFLVGTSPTAVPKRVGFVSTDGTLPNAIDVTGAVTPRSGNSFNVFWTVSVDFANVEFAAAAPTSAFGSSDASSARTEVLFLLRRLCELLPALERAIGADPAPAPTPPEMPAPGGNDPKPPRRPKATTRGVAKGHKNAAKKTKKSSRKGRR